MIYVFLGDRLKTTEAVRKNVDNLLKKKPDAEVFKVDEDNFSYDLILELINSQGLFSKKYIVVLDSVFLKNIDLKDSDLLHSIKNSEHIFFIIEEKINDSDKKVLDKFFEKITVFEKKESVQSFNVFSLANDLGRKDKKNLWVGFIKATSFGVEPEEILGVFFWQIKMILISFNTKDPKEFGVSPFAYKNAVSFAKNWKQEELLSFSDKIVEISDMTRSGEGESIILLEKLILEI